ncbi:MAG: hypothetical protein HKO86_03460 [Gammaproteobacteria bacterium]|nr:hypothetical protein [Gammaproteobacteria bacterium]NNL06758.1 hypothetical protein [Gammaproteobacteria bacterium]
MTEDNSGNLPILDDIIKTGDVDKATPESDTKVQNSVMADDDTVDPASMTVFAETAMPGNDGTDIIDLTSDGEESPGDNLPDIEALTEEILFAMLPELEQTLRVKIRQALDNHFHSTSDTD